MGTARMPGSEDWQDRPAEEVECRGVDRDIGMVLGRLGREVCMVFPAVSVVSFRSDSCG